MRGELEKLLLGAALAFVLGCHLGLGKVLPLWLAGTGGAAVSFIGGRLSAADGCKNYGSRGSGPVFLLWRCSWRWCCTPTTACHISLHRSGGNGLRHGGSRQR